METCLKESISLTVFLYKWLSKKWPIKGLNVSHKNSNLDIGSHILDCFIKANLVITFSVFTVLVH